MSQYLGDISAYALAVSQGYTGTEEEYAELMASYATVGQTAVTAAQTATTKASEAATSATTATNKASEATTAATTATTKAGEASTSASTATSAKDTAVSAKDDAVSANTAAQSAKTAAQAAQTGAETAAASVQSSAAQIATNAEDISQLKSDIADKTDTADMLKAFPTDTASGSVASFSDGANVPVKSLIVNIDPVQSGSGDPSPDNIRPISGWSEVNVEHTGKNLLDASSVESGVVASKDGSLVVSGEVIASKGDGAVSFTTSAAWKGVTTDYIPVVGNQAYNISNVGTVSYYLWAWYDANKNFISREASSTSTLSATKTAPSNARYLRLTLQEQSAGTFNLSKIQLELGSTATDYEPYQGESITISLGQTVYGGKLDVVSGELVIDYAKITIDGSSTIGQTGSAVSSPVLIQIIPPAQDIAFVDEKTIPRCLCGSYLPPTTAYGIYRSADLGIAINQAESRTPRRIWMRLPEVTTEAQAKTYLTNNPIEVVYPIYNPLTVQLTPNEVTALLGSNNVWADSGDSVVEYRADPTLYIGRLTEPDADMVADANIVSGQYFMVGNTLYKATANIASGGAITPNVNCTRKSLSEALNELNS